MKRVLFLIGVILITLNAFTQAFVEKYNYTSVDQEDTEEWVYKKSVHIIIFNLEIDEHIEIYSREKDKIYILEKLTEPEDIEIQGIPAVKYRVLEGKKYIGTVIYTPGLFIIKYTHNGQTLGFYANKPDEFKE